ncbi:uncharacterized protein NPIL_599781 [Nephila pilipes]|uniref:Gustatory receptor n=1 Tax=Nephila pilipes TaxID=299642 RepID=A0A8X6J730_NEPPI|nr:uncharacterized protein NPIL_599781 [Nephila pilipes]
MNIEKHSVLKCFYPVLLLLHIIGMETLPYPKCLEQAHLQSVLWNVPKYLIGFLQFFIIMFQSVNTIILPDKKISIPALLLVLSQALMNYRAYRSRKQFLSIIKKVSKATSMFTPVDKRKNSMMSVFTYCVMAITLAMSYTILFFYSSIYIFLKEGSFGSQFLSKKFNGWFFIFSDVTALIATIILSLVFSSISVYYGLVCICFDTLCRRLKVQIRNAKNSLDCGRIIYAYLKIRTIMESLEHFMCSSAFVIVVSTMTGLFYMCYSLIFIPKYGYIDYLCYVSGGMYNCSIIGIVIVSASIANKAAEVSKEAVMSLPGIFPKYYNELKAILRKNCKQQVCLTLWNIYIIDRSLIITAIGVLVNYGIIVATLGTKRPQWNLEKILFQKRSLVSLDRLHHVLPLHNRRRPRIQGAKIGSTTKPTPTCITSRENSGSLHHVQSSGASKGQDGGRV